MRTVVVQVDEHRFELRELREDGPIIAVFQTAHDAAAYQQAYSIGRY